MGLLICVSQCLFQSNKKIVNICSTSNQKDVAPENCNLWILLPNILLKKHKSILCFCSISVPVDLGHNQHYKPCNHKPEACKPFSTNTTLDNTMLKYKSVSTTYQWCFYNIHFNITLKGRHSGGTVLEYWPLVCESYYSLGDFNVPFKNCEHSSITK